MSMFSPVRNVRGVWLALMAALALSVGCGGTADDGGPCEGAGCLPPAGDPCIQDGITYEPEDPVPSPDGCNSCGCIDGEIVCTTADCPDAQCTHDGIAYSAGATFMASDGCNTCSCNTDGGVSCTERACDDPLRCEYAGTSVASGQSISAGDGCNTCSCFDGTIACTMVDCGVPCAANDACAEDAYCAFSDGFCGPGGGFASSGAEAPGMDPAPAPNPPGGRCQSRPQGCTLEYNPVCGCDGATYGNACAAAAAGISVVYAGTCD